MSSRAVSCDINTLLSGLSLISSRPFQMRELFVAKFQDQTLHLKKHLNYHLSAVLSLADQLIRPRSSGSRANKALLSWPQSSPAPFVGGHAERQHASTGALHSACAGILNFDRSGPFMVREAAAPKDGRSAAPDPAATSFRAIAAN